MARKLAVSTGWLRSVRPLITANVENESLIERRYNELIGAATRLFERKGFDKTTIEEIATSSTCQLEQSTDTCRARGHSPADAGANAVGIPA